jgi:NAD(P)-dependent dehydrogenase (short-subunit alcohol dehydrogenase family)
MPRLEDEIILVTGVTGNVGWGIAHAARDAGAKLVLPVRRPDAQAEIEAELPGDRVFVPLVDSTDEASLRRAVREVTSRFGTIDHVVAPLGAWWQKGASLEQDASELRSLLAIMIEAPWLLLKTVAPALRASGGSFTFVTGAAGEARTVRGAGLMVAAVGGQLALSRAMRAELEIERFRVREIRIGARIERELRPGVVPSWTAGALFVEVLEAQDHGVVYRFASDGKLVAMAGA